MPPHDVGVANGRQICFRRWGSPLPRQRCDEALGPPNSEACSANLHQILAVCEDLGVPLAMDKLDGPTQCLTFLGIEIDTQAGILRLSADKLSRLKAQLMGRSARKSCRRYQLEALIGTLQRACRVVRPGRAFLRRMIDFEGPVRLQMRNSCVGFAFAA